MPDIREGGCQCGKVRFRVEMEIGEVAACNCSRCRRLGSLFAFASADKFTLLSGEADLTTYNFNRHAIHHKFCSTCGIESFASGSDPKTRAETAAINVRCIDGIDVSGLTIRNVDGKRL